MPARTKVSAVVVVLVILALVGGSFLTACKSKATAPPPQNLAVNDQPEEEEQVIAMQNDKTTESTQPEKHAVKPANSAEETPPLNNLPLLLSFTPISRADYIARYGETDSSVNPVIAAANNIAQVTINHNLFQPGILKPGDNLLISSFNGTTYRVVIETVNTVQQSFTLSGKTPEKTGGSLALSFTASQLLAELNLPGQNKLLLISYNQASASHYLYEAVLNEIIIIGEDGLLIPPTDD
ncbi:MAG: hypothetical protein U1E11_09505 [Dethiobacteria bacterium]|nr:hypothetical protein [Dethiobacteria bacterium]